MPKARIVVVEDEPAIRRGVVDALRITGYEVAEAADGADGFQKAMPARYRPGTARPAAAEARRPRRAGRTAPKVHPRRAVIILTARGSEDDRVRGLQSGCRRLHGEALQRPRTAGPRRGDAAAHVVRTGGRRRTGSAWGRAVIDLARREILWSKAERTEISETEAALLGYLVRPPGTGGAARGTALARLGHLLRRPGDADHRHAHRPPPRQAARSEIGGGF